MLGNSDVGRRCISIVVFDGYGGIFQHAAWLCRALTESGEPAVLYCAKDNEYRASGLPYVRGLFNLRTSRSAGASVATYLILLIRLLVIVARARRQGVVHIQGTAWSPVVFVAIAVGRVTGRRMIYTPHNTFDRTGSRVGEYFLRISIRIANLAIVFSDADMARVEEIGGAGVKTALTMGVQAEAGSRAHVRARWKIAPSTKAVLFAGQIRTDKGLQALIRTVPDWPPDWQLVVVGSDAGAWESASSLAIELGVQLVADVRYLESQEFFNSIGASDVVVCPYTRASQSGILTVADEIGISTVATDVGGLREVATCTIPAVLTSDSVVRAIASAIANTKQRTTSSQQLCVSTHMMAYSRRRSNDDVAAT